MKFRTGFISNSSTACFIIDTSMTPSEIERYLKELVDRFNESNINPDDVFLEYSFDGMFKAPKMATKRDSELLMDWDSSLTFKKLKNKIILYGADDNSIPFELMEQIIEELEADHMHLG